MFIINEKNSLIPDYWKGLTLYFAENYDLGPTIPDTKTNTRKQ